MKTTLFTGAGASKAIGYPLTSELLPKIRTQLVNEDLFDDINFDETDAEAAKELKGYLEALLPGFAAAPPEDLPLITDVFSMVEHSIAAGEVLPIGGPGDLHRFRELLKRAIAILLIDVYLGHAEPNEEEEANHDLLLDWMRQQKGELGLVTTNYDIGIDRGLYEEIEDREDFPQLVDLGFDYRWSEDDQVKIRPPKPDYRIFKLHGSLDLLRCPLCGHVYFNHYGNIAHQAFRNDLDDGNICECNPKPTHRLELHIVSPSLVRDIRDANLLGVWRSALEWMRTSDRWVIAGYSLPPEDLAIRSLLVRAYGGRRKKPEVIVVQQGSAQKARYQMLFPGCSYLADGLGAFLENLE